MGADGHVNIYDYKKAKELIGDDVEKLFSSIVYKQELNGTEYITCYWGDNIYSVYDDYEDAGASYSGFTKERWQEIWELMGTCKVTHWEVWT